MCTGLLVRRSFRKEGTGKFGKKEYFLPATTYSFVSTDQEMIQGLLEGQGCPMGLFRFEEEFGQRLQRLSPQMIVRWAESHWDEGIENMERFMSVVKAAQDKEVASA